LVSATHGGITNNDGNTCGAISPDPNGGCNLVTPAFQDLGAFGTGSLLTITGFFGTFGTAGSESRDLDWYRFTLTSEAKLTVTLTNDTGGQNVLFVGPDGCPLNQIYAATGDGSQTTDQFLTAGTWVVVVTTPFEDSDPNSPPANGCKPYTLSIDIQAGDSACGTGSSQPCDVAHATPGCDDWACCNQVCLVDPTCCFQDWDQSCVTNGAVPLCGYFIYSCPGGGPSNDCATAPTVLTLNAVVDWDNTGANTDGPSPLVIPGTQWVGHDIWFVVQAPGAGNLTASICSGTPADLDTVMDVYDIGTSSTVADPQLLPAQFVGQGDDTCGLTGGPSSVTVSDTVPGNWYLIRIGGWSQDAAGVPAAPTGAGQITTAFSAPPPGEVIYETSPQKAAVNASSGALTNLGLSSGGPNAGQPRRWLAIPLTLPATPQPNGKWQIQTIIGKGFIAAAETSQLGWILWKRATGNPAPNSSDDQVATGIVPMPTPFNDADDASANSSYPIVLDQPVEVDPGNYYITIFGARPDDFANGGNAAANWAWFIYNDSGINLFDAGNVFAWRSSNWPTPGFVVYTGLNGAYFVQDGDDPNDIYNLNFAIWGEDVYPAAPCPADLNDDGQVNAADLTVLLASWGGAGGDLNASGSTDAADLTILLAAWGPCP
jgi:hypothetical protein